MSASELAEHLMLLEEATEEDYDEFIEDLLEVVYPDITSQNN